MDDEIRNIDYEVVCCVGVDYPLLLHHVKNEDKYLRFENIFFQSYVPSRLGSVKQIYCITPLIEHISLLALTNITGYNTAIIQTIIVIAEEFPLIMTLV